MLKNGNVEWSKMYLYTYHYLAVQQIFQHLQLVLENAFEDLQFT